MPLDQQNVIYPTLCSFNFQPGVTKYKTFWLNWIWCKYLSPSKCRCPLMATGHSCNPFYQFLSRGKLFYLNEFIAKKWENEQPSMTDNCSKDYWNGKMNATVWAEISKNISWANKWPSPWSSLVEVDEQLDWPNSQSTMEFCHACVT